MDINIRKHITKNFKGADISEIKASIEASIAESEDITLPGLGVFFEVLWNGSDENSREYILNTLKRNMK